MCRGWENLVNRQKKRRQAASRRCKRYVEKVEGIGRGQVRYEVLRCGGGCGGIGCWQVLG